MIGYSKKSIEDYLKESSAFDEKKKKPGLKFNPGLALTRVRTAGPRIFYFKQISSYCKAMTAKMSDFLVFPIMSFRNKGNQTRPKSHKHSQAGQLRSH